MKRSSAALLRTLLLSSACLLASSAPGVVAAPSPSVPGVEAPAPIAESWENAGTATTDPSASDRNREARIAAWIAELSGKPGFESWANASHRTEILGPGTHSWLVTVVHDGEEVGYLVVAYDPNGGLGLAEYGAGPYPLFSMTTLQRILAQRGLVLLSDSSDALQKIYLGPLESYWIVDTGEEVLYLDAKSGERLPELESDTPVAPEQAAPALLPQGSIQAEWHADASFDPLLGTEWVKPAAPGPLPYKTAADLLEALRTQPLGFSIKLFDGRCVYPFALSGMHLWSDGAAYFAVDQEGSRFVPWVTAERGIFYSPIP